ncbi:MAG: DNA repair protein RecN [Chitinivibrionales bacterium]|nr:DNA repair protein RecN [Chitinivibrionales bacterium]
MADNSTISSSYPLALILSCYAPNWAGEKISKHGMPTCMMRNISIKNLALIEDISVVFHEGFSVFTGETGAGKSLLIGAIGLLLGDRASSEMVRRGADEAEITGVFELDDPRAGLHEILDENGIGLEGDQLIIRRRITIAAKNRIFLNQIPITLATLKRIGDVLIDFHSQHEHQSLLQPESAFAIIDALPHVAHYRAEYDRAYHSYVEAGSALREHGKRAAQLRERKDLLDFQYKEISALNPRPSEEQELEEELKLLSSRAERMQYAAGISALFNSHSSSLSDALAQVRRQLEGWAKYDGSVANWLNDVDNAAALFNELESFCARYAADDEQPDPNRIESINSRLARIQRLKKKYQCDIEGLVEKRRALEQDLAALENDEADLKELRKRVEACEKKCRNAGAQLTRQRTTAANAFDGAISGHMERLGFAGGRWQTSFTPLQSPAQHGMEMIAFMVQTNPGEPFLPLAKTASGGEISRLMLATKSVLAGHDHIPTVIFDEIDAGIGGVVAGEVAQALLDLSASHQVISISHLHQLATVAHHHYHVYKETSGNRTVTHVKELSDAQKVDEIARMLGGTTNIARRHAKSLLNSER